MKMRRRPAIDAIAMEMPFIFPVRPRTQQRLKQGGILEETTALGVPFLALRENTERTVTISEGTNLRAGTDPAKIVAAARNALAGKGKAGRVPPLWDGYTAKRIVEILLKLVPRGNAS